MKWNIEKSEKLKMQIAQNEKLLAELSQVVQKILIKNNIKLDGYSYILEPRVFSFKTSRVAEISMDARKGMLKAIIEDLNKKDIQLDPDILRYIKCLPECGIIGPRTLDIFEKLRLVDKPIESVVNIKDSISLINTIVRSKDLLDELSNTVFKVLNAHGIEFEENEDCVFTPLVFETPAFAQVINKSISDEKLNGFGPQIIASPTASDKLIHRPLAGIIARDRVHIPGVFVDKWWWVGIPAPEMLVGLDRIREMRNF